MSDTPRTDERIFTVPEYDDLRVIDGMHHVVSAAFARQLERELSEERAAKERMQKALECVIALRFLP